MRSSKIISLSLLVETSTKEVVTLRLLRSGVNTSLKTYSVSGITAAHTALPHSCHNLMQECITLAHEKWHIRPYAERPGIRIGRFSGIDRHDPSQGMCNRCLGLGYS